ncbi:DUF2490 domain-containing protein [Pontibacter sp. G13]|uniref:DUF2490 domain-containing protein n=1 Tax=Pontibacter sp. G13 TaxID=3074898 RepID=UPI00288ABEE1|nr:DUF2490 domain-containing protein [Pontibacter sp. G13]WNJ19276.1 DUF2490 domain-containing protein [Pontibacter sp. G13]
MKGILLCGILLFSSSVLAQNREVFGGIFPEAAVTVKFAKFYSSTFKIESIHQLVVDRDAERPNWRYQHESTEFQFFVGYKVSPLSDFSVAYIFAVDGDGPNTHGLTEQLGVVQLLPYFKLGHRFRFDQTFFPKGEGPARLRVRYRLAMDLPLEGLEIDPNEFFLLVSDEVLVDWRDGRSDLENRFVAQLGYKFDKWGKLQGGLDYRIDRLFETGLRQRFWLKFSYFVTLK